VTSSAQAGAGLARLPFRPYVRVTMITRREALKATVLATSTLAAAPTLLAQTSSAAADGPRFTLPALPYAVDALEPHLDARTMEIHHGRHHKAFVDNLNKVAGRLPAGVTDPEALAATLADCPEDVRTLVRNNSGGHLNHALFWQMMKPGGGSEPRAELARAIDSTFGSFSAFKDTFTKAALSRFGSGWAWLVFHAGKLEVVSTANQDNPVMGQAVAGCAGVPLLGLDVWEHAYYLKYQNKRADYVAAWWNVVNWDFVAGRFLRARG
jgi:superoxide dismutase, Fe-Mn family